jgi:hypothetical protein
MVFALEDWNLTLGVIGLGVVATATVATVIDRLINPQQKWWWERLIKPQARPSSAAAEAEAEKHNRVWGYAPYAITPEEVVRKRQEGSVLPSI